MKKFFEVMGGAFRYNLESKFHQLSPRSLMINLTYKCNSQCIMCNIWRIRPKNEVSLVKWREIMEDEIFTDIRNLTISGGEPFLDEDFVPATKLFIDSMPKLRRLIINTNGFMTEIIADDIEIIAEYCNKKNVKLGVNVSIDGVGEVHNKIRGIKGGFEKSFETVKRIGEISQKYHISVSVSSLILRSNVSRYFEMKKLLGTNGIDGSFQIVGFHDNFLKNLETKKKLSINLSVRDNFLKILADIKDSKGWFNLNKYYWEDMISMYGKGTPRTTPCTFLKDDLVIDGLGDVYYCLSVRPIGNFVKEKRSVGEIYFDSHNIQYRNNLPKTSCKSCNSGCNSTNGIAYDAKRFVWYKLTGRLWPGKVLDVV
jgi:MoaA/NifB/PqqE/SkfB family radical SAM enzyme